jgi:hypothetical protein
VLAANAIAKLELPGQEQRGRQLRRPNDISVLLASNRLQITADVDAAGLEKLEKMLAKYKEILKVQ